ncbi:HAD family hydrolase [Thiohalorhabdus sp.]|uniref:HAD family hydrolase n=1 Tax=Thiohalorhabdus sp. TaxID=3094134 RepID=UPI002FC398FE
MRRTRYPEKAMPPTPQAVVFDFDGIIVDSEPAHYRAFQVVLEPRGLGYAWDRYIDYYMGLDDRDGFREAFRAAGQEVGQDELEELIAAKHAAFEGEMAVGLDPIPGAVDCVRRLREVFPLAVCSGALRGEVLPTLEGLGIAAAFRTVVSAEDVAHSKPDPASYRLAVERLGADLKRDLEPGACVAIEDTPTGAASARDAGLLVIGLDPQGAGPEGAHRTVRSLDELTAENL